MKTADVTPDPVAWRSVVDALLDTTEGMSVAATQQTVGPIDDPARDWAHARAMLL